MEPSNHTNMDTLAEIQPVINIVPGQNGFWCVFSDDPDDRNVFHM